MRNYNSFIINLSGNKPLYANGWTASKAAKLKLYALAIPITSLPFPFPFLAPSTIPGNVKIVIYSNDIEWLLAYISRWWILFLGLLKNLLVNMLSNVLFPFEGKPMRHIQVSRDFMKSKSSPFAPQEHIIDSTCSLFNFAILDFNKKRWPSMALFFGSCLFLLSIGPHSFIWEIK